jgi:hypothetical protein
MIFHSSPDHTVRRRRESSAIDVQRLDDLVCSNTETLCRHFFPSGKRINGQWRVASTPRIGRKKNKPGSLAIHLEGKFKGCWRDWSTGEHGTFIRLLMTRYSLNFQDAARAISACLGISVEPPAL